MRRGPLVIKLLVKEIRDGVLQLLPTRVAIHVEFLLYHRRFPRLTPPQTFNEKVVYRKLYDRDPRLPRLADKILVKQHIRELLGEEWVIPTLWSGNKLPPRAERNWPIPYVLKASHGSGWNQFVLTQEDQDWDRIEKTAGIWLRSTYGRASREWLYSEIKPGLLVEPFLGQAEVAPPDYKFFVFGGRTAFVQVDLGRLQTHRQYFYDLNWNRLPFKYVCPYDAQEIEPPKSLAQMVRAADRLGASFSFARIDLYEIEGKPYFGEYTFLPNSGRFEFKPESVEVKLGSLWKLE